MNVRGSEKKWEKVFCTLHNVQKVFRGWGMKLRTRFFLWSEQKAGKFPLTFFFQTLFLAFQIGTYTNKHLLKQFLNSHLAHLPCSSTANYIWSPLGNCNEMLYYTLHIQYVKKGSEKVRWNALPIMRWAYSELHLLPL